MALSFLLLQYGYTSNNASSTPQLAVSAARGDDNRVSRGSRGNQGFDLASLASSETEDGWIASGLDLEMLTTTTTTPTTTTTTTIKPTTTTTAKPTTTTLKPKPKPKAPIQSVVPTGDDVWVRLARCESGIRNDGGAPYYGYFQFSAATWRSIGGTGLPDEHSYDVQLAFAKKLQARSGWGQWPVCSQVALRG